MRASSDGIGGRGGITKWSAIAARLRQNGSAIQIQFSTIIVLHVKNVVASDRSGEGCAEAASIMFVAVISINQAAIECIDAVGFPRVIRKIRVAGGQVADSAAANDQVINFPCREAG